MRKLLVLTLALILLLCGCTKAPAEEEGKVTDFYISGFEDAVPSDTTEQEEKEPTVSKLSFAAVGDNIIYQCGFTDAKNRANSQYPEYNFMPIYENIRPAIEAADISYINQETMMSGAEYGYSDYPCFNSPQHLGDQLTEIGFDIVNIANNHMLDTTTPGLLDTIEY